MRSFLLVVVTIVHLRSIAIGKAEDHAPVSEEGLLSRSRATRGRWARGRAKAGGLAVRGASSRGSALELLQVLPKPVDGPLFRQPDIVMQPLNMGDDVAREHEQLFPGLGHMIQGVHPLF